jgi:four helix bundle protein
MKNEEEKIKSFTDLITWKEGHKLVLLTYKQTRHFPKGEIFGLVSQMRRCAVSITSNIAEGFSRKSYKEKVQFYSISLGSVTELQNQLIIAKDVNFLEESDFKEIMETSIIVHKIINGLIKKLKTLILNS